MMLLRLQSLQPKKLEVHIWFCPHVHQLTKFVILYSVYFVFLISIWNAGICNNLDIVYFSIGRNFVPFFKTKKFTKI
jgi:hypothetical protein